jgi:hypothetical protein
MKAKKLLLISFLSLSILSCKNDEKKEEGNDKQMENVKQKFSVELDVIAPVEDNFTVYYTEDGTNTFTSDKAVWSGVKGQTTSQKVTLDLSEEIIPTNIRIDFGISKDQGDVVLEKFKLSYYGKSFEARGSDFLKYFVINSTIKTQIDEVKGTITFLKNPTQFYTPFYDPQVSIQEEIKKITK